MERDVSQLIVSENAPYRPRVSRETRRLLMTALLAVLVLWILARIRFPDRPVNPNPVPPLLTQLTDVPAFADLAASVDDLRRRLTPALVSIVPVRADLATTATRGHSLTALRIRDDLAIAILEPDAAEDDVLGVIAKDRATGLAVVRIARETPFALPSLWSAQRLDAPRFVMASSPSPRDVSLRPAFIGSLTPIEMPGWTAPVWSVPKEATLVPGAFLFTEDAELVGAVVPRAAGAAVVPAQTLLTAADDLLAHPPQIPFDLGVDVQALTPSLSMASGAETGVVVTWVDPKGPAARDVRAGDVILSIDGVNVQTLEEWRVRTARVEATGATIALKVMRRGAQRDVALVATAPVEAIATPALGLMLRTVAGMGVEVMRVDPGSTAAAAGVEPGDILTAIGDINAPGASQVRLAFAAARRGDLLTIAITRGSTHRMVVLQR